MNLQAPMIVAMLKGHGPSTLICEMRVYREPDDQDVVIYAVKMWVGQYTDYMNFDNLKAILLSFGPNINGAKNSAAVYLARYKDEGYKINTVLSYVPEWAKHWPGAIEISSAGENHSPYLEKPPKIPQVAESYKAWDQSLTQPSETNINTRFLPARLRKLMEREPLRKPKTTPRRRRGHRGRIEID